MDTWEIEEIVNQYIIDHDAKPSEKGFEGYKYATCISINDEVAHATPRKGLKLKNHDVVTVDFCVSGMVMKVILLGLMLLVKVHPKSIT